MPTYSVQPEVIGIDLGCEAALNWSKYLSKGVY